MRLLSNLGEALENTTLFVHVAISEKWAGEVQYIHFLLNNIHVVKWFTLPRQ